VAVGIDPVRDAGEAFGRPGAFVDVHRVLLSRAGAGARAYSSFTLAALITLFQRSTSARMNAAVSDTEPPTGSAERSARRLRTSGSRTASAISVLILPTIAAGVFGGATTANQAEDAKPGSVSAMVGTSGSALMRFSVPTAISLSFPLFTSPSET